MLSWFDQGWCLQLTHLTTCFCFCFYHDLEKEAWTNIFPWLPQLVKCQWDTHQVLLISIMFRQTPTKLLSVHILCLCIVCVCNCRYRGWLVRRVCCMLFVSGCKVYPSPVSNRLERIWQSNRYLREKINMTRGVAMPEENEAGLAVLIGRREKGREEIRQTNKYVEIMGSVEN